MLTDINGVYDLSDVIAITRGGTPNPAVRAGHTKPTAILHYANGRTMETLAAYDAALKEWAVATAPDAEDSGDGTES